MASRARQTIAVACLFNDLLLAHFFKFSLFTTFDLRRYKIAPYFKERIRIGYFQHFPERRGITQITEQFIRGPEENNIVIHIRGGDLLSIERAGKGSYGLLTRSYFQAGIDRAFSDIAGNCSREPSPSVFVVTDDERYARTLNLKTNTGSLVKICSPPLNETISIALNATKFVSSNSTLSYWLVRLRQHRSSIVPRPFQARREYSMPEKTMSIRVDYQSSKQC